MPWLTIFQRPWVWLCFVFTAWRQVQAWTRQWLPIHHTVAVVFATCRVHLMKSRRFQRRRNCVSRRALSTGYSLLPFILNISLGETMMSLNRLWRKLTLWFFLALFLHLSCLCDHMPIEERVRWQRWLLSRLRLNVAQTVSTQERFWRESPIRLDLWDLDWWRLSPPNEFSLRYMRFQATWKFEISSELASDLKGILGWEVSQWRRPWVAASDCIPLVQLFELILCRIAWLHFNLIPRF